MALFVLVLVGVVVAQTWLDWSDTRKNWVIPDWAKGTALGGVLAVSLAAVTSFVTVWIQDSNSPSGSELPKLFWPELAFLLCMMGVIILSVRKKRKRLLFLLMAGVFSAFWLVIKLFS